MFVQQYIYLSHNHQRWLCKSKELKKTGLTSEIAPLLVFFMIKSFREAFAKASLRQEGKKNPVIGAVRKSCRHHRGCPLIPDYPPRNLFVCKALLRQGFVGQADSKVYSPKPWRRGVILTSTRHTDKFH